MKEIFPTKPNKSTQFAINKVMDISFSEIIRLLDFYSVNISNRNLKIKIEYNEVKFKLFGGSLRLGLFYSNLLSGNKMECACCGKKASSFILNKQQKSCSPTLELCNESGEIFTHDHILARSLGGNDDENNIVMMCSTCNNIKNYNFELKKIPCDIDTLRDFLYGNDR